MLISINIIVVTN